VQEIAIDRWNSTAVNTALQEEGFTINQFGQGFASMAAPVKELKRAILTRHFRHGGNTLLRMCFGNVVADKTRRKTRSSRRNGRAGASTVLLLPQWPLAASSQTKSHHHPMRAEKADSSSSKEQGHAPSQYHRIKPGFASEAEQGRQHHSGILRLQGERLGAGWMRLRSNTAPGLTGWPPKLEGADAARRSVGVADEQLRSVMVRQAQASYCALGGTDGEWIKTWDEEETEEADEGKGLRRFLSNGAE